MDCDGIAEITFTSADRLRDLISNVNADGSAQSAGPRRRRGGTSHAPHFVRHLLGAYDLQRDRLHGPIEHPKGRTAFLAFCSVLSARSSAPTGASSPRRRWW